MLRTPAPSCTMNITPMIDVLLVLLVIFMAAIPLTQHGLDVKLPRPAEAPAAPPPSSIVLEISDTREMAINQQPVSMADLHVRLRGVFDDRRDKTLFISGASTLPYGDVVAIMDTARGAGVNRLGVITEGARRAAAGN